MTCSSIPVRTSPETLWAQYLLFTFLSAFWLSYLLVESSIDLCLQDFSCSLTYLLKLFKIPSTNQFQKPKKKKKDMVRFGHCHATFPLIVFYSSFVITVTTHPAETRTKRIKIKMAVMASWVQVQMQVIKGPCC